MSTTRPAFVNLEVADYNVSHYWEFPAFQPGLLDLLRRRITILNRIQAVPATGHPTRYREQTKIPTNAIFADPRKGVGGGSYGIDTINDDYGRVERAAMLKAMVSRIRFTLFDKELVQQQGNMEFLLAKDMQDMMFDFLRVQNDAIWNGTDTSLAAPTKLEYMGLLKQITTQVEIPDLVVPTNASAAKGDNYISDFLCRQIAELEADNTWEVYPTAFYANPLTIQFINEQERFRKGLHTTANESTLEISTGYRVPYITTMKGNIPLIPEPYIKLDGDTHKIAAVNESLIERHYLTSPAPRIFKMSLHPDLMDDYIAVLFDTVIVKGADHGHFIAEFEVPAA